MAVVIGGGGTSSVTAPITVSGTGTGYTYSTASNKTSSSINLEGKESDILIQGKSMKAWMESVEKRLAILQPNPELQEKYEALQEAYEHYKTLEAILYEQE